MDKYSPEELEKIIQQYERSQMCQKPKKSRKPAPKVLCEICCVEIAQSGLKAHQKTNRHLLLADIQATSQELRTQLNQANDLHISL